MAASALAAAFTVGSQAYQGEQARKSQNKAIRAQDKVAGDAEARALSQQRQNAQNIRQANQRKPDLGRLLAASQRFGLGGLGSTNLTGPLGAPLGR